MEYFEFRAMNTDILLAAEGGAACLARAFEHIRAFVRTSEKRFTRFSDQSELARLNRSGGGGTWFHASEELYEILRQAREFYDETGGLFDPSILDALERAGYDRSMEEIKAGGGIVSVQGNTPRERPDFGAVEFDPRTRAIRLPAKMRIDLGGVAKGWIAERAADLLAAFTDTCAVNAGGDLFAIGQPVGGWEIALEDPRDPAHALAVLRTGPGAVATSSITRRRWQVGDRSMHHLIDPRRAAPAETDWLSVTAIVPHGKPGSSAGATAEVYAKALLIAGSRGADQVHARRSDIAYIAVDANGQLWGSDNSKEYLDVSGQYA